MAKISTTKDYAKAFLIRLRRYPDQRFLIAVNEEHVPTMVLADSALAANRLNKHPGSVVGVYQCCEDITASQLASDIDYIDDYIPKKLRGAA